MDKQQQKKSKTREIDAGIVGCALGDQGCDEAELVRLAIEYATEFRCPYQLSAAHMRSLETDAERGVARRLEANVNNIIRTTMRSTVPGLAGMSRLVITKLTDQPPPIPRRLVRTCECTESHRSPKCKMPVELCKHTALHLAKQVSRTSPRSPKSGGTRKAIKSRLRKSRKSRQSRQSRH